MYAENLLSQGVYNMKKIFEWIKTKLNIHFVVRCCINRVKFLWLYKYMQTVSHDIGSPHHNFACGTIKYGEEMVNKDYLYNVIEAPSYKSVYDCYPTLNIRDDGIKLVYAIKEESEVVLKTGGNDLQKMYKLLCNEKEVEDAFLSEGITSCTVN